VLARSCRFFNGGRCAQASERNFDGCGIAAGLNLWVGGERQQESASRVPSTEAFLTLRKSSICFSRTRVLIDLENIHALLLCEAILVNADNDVLARVYAGLLRAAASSMRSLGMPRLNSFRHPHECLDFFDD